MSLPEDFVFSQSALQDYADCARRFELRYVRDVRWPALETQSVLEHEAQTQKGQSFHHLVHQHALGVPAAALEATIEDEELRAWWQRYLQWQTQLPIERFPELTLTAPLGEALLMAQYDLVVKLTDGTFLIVDWKTGKPPKRARLAERLQTLVYPYVLSQAGAWLNDNQPIPPDRIRMVYWYATDGSQLEFPATAETLVRDETKLAELLDRIANDSEWLLTKHERACRFCVYRSLCERGDVAGSLDELEEDNEFIEPVEVDFDAVEEIAF
jgi:PD-(D/E)XK nuclease superfamily